ncbi:MAG: PhzF family phenazine biosynthesis protein [Rhizobiales bacterium]|nr:PhzF family phenazine biosynthesis protein [Hyphomicrobiales bacterium]
MTEFLTYDVFTQHKLCGNPLAIIPNAKRMSDTEMLNITQEFNLSETIFIYPKQDGAYEVRIFTPAQELPFAGHPTIGASIAIARDEKGSEFTGKHHVNLIEKAGAVAVSLDLNSNGCDYAEFIAPQIPKSCNVAISFDQVAEILSLNAADIGFDDYLPDQFDGGVPFYSFPIRNRAALANIKINTLAVEKYIKGKFHRAFHCFTNDIDDGVDFATRMFSLDLGMNEDPATGSAATSFAGAIASYAALGDKEHKFTLDQGVDMGRPSEIYLTIVMQNGKINQVRIGGYAVPYSKGSLL